MGFSRRWPSFSSCRCSYLEQSAWSCHFCAFCSCLRSSGPGSKPTCLTFLTLPSVLAQWRLVALDTIIVLAYLLTYFIGFFTICAVTKLLTNHTTVLLLRSRSIGYKPMGSMIMRSATMRSSVKVHKIPSVIRHLYRHHHRCLYQVLEHFLFWFFWSGSDIDPKG